jgi:23S rRNA pseudouridine1911/1915/1917 synthase
MIVAASLERLTVRIGPEGAGTRLDKTLAEALPHLSRTRLKALMESGRVTLGGETVTEPSRRVKPGEVFEIEVPATTPAVPKGQAIDLAIVYEDADLIVVDKPAGMVVHPAPGNPDRTLVNALIAHCGASLSGIGGAARPGIVHRIDKDTSGLIVAAKNDRAHRELARQFEEHSLDRAYTAAVWGVPAERKGEIEGNIGRDPRNRKKMAVVARGGKPALTRYKLIRRLGLAASLIECRLATGRTHQIRVHMAKMGHPVIGDPLYGGRKPRGKARNSAEISRFLETFGRQALHAHLIGFYHPSTKAKILLMSDLPIEFNELLKILES